MQCSAIQYNTIQYNTTQYNTIQYNKYLLLAECEVRTASYGPIFVLPFMAQARRARAMKTRKEKTRNHNLPTDRADDANKMFYYMALLIIPGKERFDRA